MNNIENLPRDDFSYRHLGSNTTKTKLMVSLDAVAIFEPAQTLAVGEHALAP
jgi:hypothetical protein